MIPVVVHHSDTGWTAATQVAELFSPRIAAIPEVGKFIPQLEFILDDISHASDEELQSRADSALENLLPLVLLGTTRRAFPRETARQFSSLAAHLGELFDFTGQAGCMPQFASLY